MYSNAASEIKVRDRYEPQNEIQTLNVKKIANKFKISSQSLTRIVTFGGVNESNFGEPIVDFNSIDVDNDKSEEVKSEVDLFLPKARK